MARQKNAKDRGFSPENLLAGLDADSIEDNSNERTDLSEDNFKNDRLEKIEDKINEKVDVLENELNSEINLEVNPDTVEDKTMENEESIRPTLEELVKKTDTKKAQENIYLHEDVKDDLEAFGKLIGKTNGGKSYLVETALLEYFERNQDYLDLARKKYGKKRKK